MKTISHLNRQELSVTAWAFATLKLRPQPLLTAIASAAIPRIQDFGALEISNFAWACAHIAYRNEPLRAALAAQSITTGTVGATNNGVSDIANPNGIYSMVWSSWRAVWPELARGLAKDPRVPRVEPAAHGLLVMDCEWQHSEGLSRSLGGPTGFLTSSGSSDGGLMHKPL